MKCIGSPFSFSPYTLHEMRGIYVTYDFLTKKFKSLGDIFF